MRIVTFCSPSHFELRDAWFLKTFPNGCFLDRTLTEQSCPSGEWGSLGWREAMMEKIRAIASAAARLPDKIIAYSDVDVQFFGLAPVDLLIELGDYDIAFQRHCLRGTVCTGFFVCRTRPNVLRLFADVLECLRSNTHNDDQVAVNTLLGVCRAPRIDHVLTATDQLFIDSLYGKEVHTARGVTWRYLSNRFWTLGQSLLVDVSAPSVEITDAMVPQGILVHHAAWATGEKKKVEQLAAVRSIWEKRNAA